MDASQIIKGLGRLKEFGFPVKFYTDSICFYPDAGLTDFAVIEGDPLRATEMWDGQDLIRGFVEREMDGRGFWADYQDRLQDSVPQLESFPPKMMRRPTLLEVVEAAVGVLEAHRGG
jgi:hypothetical protein